MSFHGEFGNYNGSYGNRFQTFYSQDSAARPITIGEAVLTLEYERLEIEYRREIYIKYSQEFVPRPTTMCEAFLNLAYEKLENVYRKKIILGNPMKIFLPIFVKL